MLSRRLKFLSEEYFCMGYNGFHKIKCEKIASTIMFHLSLCVNSHNIHLYGNLYGNCMLLPLVGFFCYLFV